ncbi:MAG: MASE1 domain-containing protein [Nitriliruptorales bacterium]
MSEPSLTRSRAAHATRILGLAAAYLVTAKLGLLLAVPPGVATPVWPPTGISLAALLLLGPRLWPGVALGAFAANLQPGVPLTAVIAISIGNTLEAVVGTLLLRHVAGFRSIERVRDVLALATLGALVSTTISATFGSTALLATGTIGASEYPYQWRVWWLGDAMGDLLVAPLILAWAGRVPRAWRAKRLLEGVTLAVAIGVVAWTSFVSRQLAYSYLLFPLLIWCALRFRQRGVTAAGLYISGVAVWAALEGVAIFEGVSSADSLLLLQALASVVAVTSLVIAAAIREREFAEERVRDEAVALRLLQRVAVASNEASSFDGAVASAVRDICIQAGLSRGRAYMRDSRGELTSTRLWAVDDRSPGGELHELAAEAAIEPGLGAAGQAALSGRPVVLDGEASVPDGEVVSIAPGETISRRRLASKSPRSWSVVALPINAGAEVAAVLEFCSQEPISADHLLLRVAEPLVNQMRRVVERERHEELQHRLLATTSHEIRTPLTLIHGFAAMLLEDWDKHDEASRRDLLERVVGHSQELHRLVENLLTSSRIDEGYLESRPEATDVAALAATVVRDLGLDNVKVVAASGGRALADPAHLRLILVNYLTNAHKYGRPPFTIGVRATGSAVEIRVEDRGEGVPSEFQQQLFQRFATAAHNPSGTPSIGLGLSIARDLARIQGGDTRYEPNTPSGACFVVRLPAHREG